MADTAANKYIDINELNAYRKQTTISGHYLVLWDVIAKYLVKLDSIIDVNDYLVTFTENEYVVYCKKPSKNKMPGGGNGECTVDKVNMKFIDCKFIK